MCNSEPGAWSVTERGALFETEQCPPQSVTDPHGVHRRAAVVGRVAFETDGLNSEHKKRIDAMDAVWVPTQWQADVFAREGVKTVVRVVPEPVDTDFYRPLKGDKQQRQTAGAALAEGALGRALSSWLGLGDSDSARNGAVADAPLPLPLSGASAVFPRWAQECADAEPKFTFVSVFKWEQRKAWDVLARAFAAEFDPKEGVSLHVLTSEYHNDASAFVGAFREAAGGGDTPSCAYVSAEHVAQADMPRLYGAADAFVLASRGEGWGRPHAEAMSCGVPVVATNWSGTTAFINEQTGYLVKVRVAISCRPTRSLAPRCKCARATSRGAAAHALCRRDTRHTQVDRMVEITDEASPFRGHMWAEPSEVDLRRRMREAVSDKSGLRYRALAARREAVMKYSIDAVAKLTLAAAKGAAGDREEHLQRTRGGGVHAQEYVRARDEL